MVADCPQLTDHAREATPAPHLISLACAHHPRTQPSVWASALHRLWCTGVTSPCPGLSMVAAGAPALLNRAAIHVHVCVHLIGWPHVAIQ